jgi:hypothetical protein
MWEWFHGQCGQKASSRGPSLLVCLVASDRGAHGLVSMCGSRELMENGKNRHISNTVVEQNPGGCKPAL